MTQARVDDPCNARSAPLKSDKKLRFECERPRGHAGPHEALNRDVRWDKTGILRDRRDELETAGRIVELVGALKRSTSRNR